MSDLLLARAAIADLVHTYAFNVRNGNPVDCMRLFTEDATFEVQEPKPGYHSEVRTRYRLTDLQAISHHLARASTTRICPIISNLLIAVQGRTATSTCVMTSLVLATGMLIVGEYHDTFRCDTEWRFASRVFTILGEYSQQPVSTTHRS